MSAGNRGRERPPALASPLRTDELPAAVECPFCGCRDSEQFSSFGSSLSLSQYYCNGCRTVFEAFKWRAREPDSDLPRPGVRREPA